MSYNQKKFLDYNGLIHLLKKFDDYPTNDILGTVIDSIGAAIDAKVSDVQVNGTSILSNGVANVPISSQYNFGVIKNNGEYGVYTDNNGFLRTASASTEIVKAGTNSYRTIKPSNQHEATFYGLAKAAGDTTQSQSSNAVGVYTNEAKAAIQTMLDVPSNATVTSAIGTAIGNVHQFSIEVVQALPTENIQEHTVYFVPKTGETNDVYDEYVYVNNGWEMIGNTQIDLSNYVQKMDYASKTNDGGIIKIANNSGSSGLYMGSDNILKVSAAPADVIKVGTNYFYPITSDRAHTATFYGLAKAAGDTTQSVSENAIGTYTDEASAAIRSMLGAVGTEDIATTTTPGIVRVNSYGLQIIDGDRLSLYMATPAELKTGTVGYHPIGPSIMHTATFYGLAKAAGDTTQALSDNAVGTYTDAAKTAIRTMLGAIGINDYATNSTCGIIKIGGGLEVTSNGALYTYRARSNQIKAGIAENDIISPYNQHESAFYGLAKAAGDTTQSQSSNAVGTYTDAAKTAIQTMLGVESGVAFVENISSATPSFTGEANTRYMCGEVTSIAFSVPSTGTVDVVFSSGSTPALLTVTPPTGLTIKWPAWFDPTALATNTTYEISIMDGIYGGVMAW